MQRTHSPYSRRLVEFHRENGIGPRSSSLAPLHVRPRVEVPTPASPPRHLHALALLFVLAVSFAFGLLALEYAQLVAIADRAEAERQAMQSEALR